MVEHQRITLPRSKRKRNQASRFRQQEPQRTFNQPPGRRQPQQSRPHPVPDRRDCRESSEEIFEPYERPGPREPAFPHPVPYRRDRERIELDSSTSSSGTEFRPIDKIGPAEEPGTNEPALQPFDVNDPILQMNRRSHAVSLAGDRIERTEIPIHLRNGQPFGLIISEVNNPAKFWFHLNDDSQIYEKLMEDFYFLQFDPPFHRFSEFMLPKSP